MKAIVVTDPAAGMAGMTLTDRPDPAAAINDRAQLGEIVQRVREGRVRTNIGTTASLADAVPALTSPQRRKGKTVILVRR
jgi:NADPH:quinone reductase-like Zn-dependent oxidoreductase